MMVDGKPVPVSFADQAFIDELRFPDQSGWKELTIGKGKLLIASYPVEMSEGNDATAAVYAAALRRAGVEPPYEVKQLSVGSPGATHGVSKTPSSTSSCRRVDATNPSTSATRLTGAEIKFTLPEQRAALVLLNKKDGKVIGTYGH